MIAKLLGALPEEIQASIGVLTKLCQRMPARHVENEIENDVFVVFGVQKTLQDGKTALYMTERWVNLVHIGA